ncbi:MAG: hypothetical protein JSS22_18610 [Proteobacteria bacterium]|nr:hypothetical protein [Pseudomonadota bacterium]
MSQVTSKSDPRQRTEKKTMSQTDKPWKQPIEKEQDSGTLSPEDLERWQNTNTH